MVSTSADCTGLVSIFKTATPTAMDWAQNPVVGAGVVPNGTYRCIAAHTSDVQSFIPQDTTGICTAGQTYSWDIFTPATATRSVAPEGTVITPHGGIGAPVEDDPWSYLSTSGSTSNSGSEPSKAFPLGSPWVINGDLSRQLVIDYDGTIGDDNYGGTHYCIPIIPPTTFIR